LPQPPQPPLVAVPKKTIAVPKRKKLVPKPPKFKVPKKVPKRVATFKSNPHKNNDKICFKKWKWFFLFLFSEIRELSTSDRGISENLGSFLFF
jgi:hypothetical protein